MSFELTTLGEYVTVQGGYAYKSRDFSENGLYPVIKIKNVRFGVIDYSETSFIDEEIARETQAWRTQEGDILISMTGSGPNAPQSLVGRAARVWGNEPAAWINQRVGRVVLKDDKTLDPDLIYYFLSLSSTQDYLVSNSSGSANQANISGKVIESLPFPKVDFHSSSRIAKILREIDQKIILNHQTNQTLESIAQAIFKSWFVDFDPVKAKITTLEAGGSQAEAEQAAMMVISAKSADELAQMQVNDPEAYQQLAETAALFPAKLVESELGLIPEGWETGLISELCVKVQNGGTPKRSEALYWDKGNIPWLTSGEVRQSIIINTENFITQIGLEKSSAKWIPELSTLVALYGATAGEVSLTSIPLTTNQAICSLIPKKNYQWYNYMQMKSRVAELAGKAVGSAQQNISKGLVENTSALCLGEEIVAAFNVYVGNCFEQRIANLKENILLGIIRDTLLPKLLSGEIDLSQLPTDEADP